jgi:hypothetical protein
MRHLAAVVCVILAISIAANACGQERWPVKVLTDKDRHMIAKTPKSATVTFLGGLNAPPNDERTAANAKTHRIADPEKTTYSVKAILLGYRKEGDGDFHLVLQDPNDQNATMIAEIPDPQCVNDPTLASHLDKFRQALVARFGAPGKKTKRLAHPARITLRGIGFFDIAHATEQDGKAPNNIELHPVIGMSLGQSL